LDKGNGKTCLIKHFLSAGPQLPISHLHLNEPHWRLIFAYGWQDGLVLFKFDSFPFSAKGVVAALSTCFLQVLIL